MNILIIIATLAVTCIATPHLSTTDRPSPINPSVLSEAKPDDKTTLITDLKEVNKYKGETSKPFHPTVLPEEGHHHVTKRENKPGYDNHGVAKPKAPVPPKKATIPETPVLKPQPSSATKLPLSKRNRRNVQPTQQKDDVAAKVLQKPETLSAAIHKDVPQTLPKKQQPQTLVAHHENNVPAIGLQKAQTLPGKILEGEPKNPVKTPTIVGHQQHKRDIPVPLVPKLKHPEVSSKVSSSEEDSSEDSDEKKNDKKKEHQQIVTSHNANAQVEDLPDPKPVNKHTLSSLKHPHEFLPQRDHIENKQTVSEEQKSVTLGDVQQKPNTNKDAADSTSDEHPLIRPKPVPVAELFSRHHDN